MINRGYQYDETGNVTQISNRRASFSLSEAIFFLANGNSSGR